MIYVIIPAANVNSRAAEQDSIEGRATKSLNNLVFFGVGWEFGVG